MTAPHNLAANPSPDSVILNFVNQLVDTPDYYEEICDAQFTDLRHSGTLSLVVDLPGRVGCGPVIVDKTTTGFRQYSLGDGPAEIKGLAGNGALETNRLYQIYTFPERGRSLRCVVAGHMGLDGNAYTDVSNRYKTYMNRNWRR